MSSAFKESLLYMESLKSAHSMFRVGSFIWWVNFHLSITYFTTNSSDEHSQRVPSTVPYYNNCNWSSKWSFYRVLLTSNLSITDRKFYEKTLPTSIWKQMKKFTQCLIIITLTSTDTTQGPLINASFQIWISCSLQNLITTAQKSSRAGWRFC